METIGSSEAKAHLPRLLVRVAAGDEFTITKHGVPVAMLVPLVADRRRKLVEVVRGIEGFSRRHSLGGLSIREMIEEGRRC